MNALETIISEKISRGGPISFRDYMEMALYYPGLGYYASDRKKIGAEGDFFTSCTISPVFGRLLARQIREMWELSGEKEFTVVEYGAGTGHLCKAILDYFGTESDLLPLLHYCIIEKSAALQQVQQEFLPEGVRWLDSIAGVRGFKGCVLANEVADNFAVHRVVMREELMEVFVDHQAEGFSELLRPASEELRQYFSALQVRLPQNFETEVNLQCGEWLREITENMAAGFFMTIDYGYLSGDLYAAARRQGTLTCYHRHKVSESYYREVGSCDITAHLNFSALALYGSRNGFELSGFREQGPFLQALGFFGELRRIRPEDPAEIVAQMKRENALANTLLEDMGKKFKVLVLQKNMPRQRLQGFNPVFSEVKPV